MSAHFEEALKRTGPTVQATTLQKFRRFAHEYDPGAESKIIAQQLGEESHLTEVNDDEPLGRPRDYLEVDTKDRGRSCGSTRCSSVGSNSRFSSNSRASNAVTVTSTHSIYSTLDSSRVEIRLLRIKDPGWSTGKVECELEVVTLLSSPKFTAFSYVWGDSKFKEKVVIDGKTVSVTRNLACALRNATYQWQAHYRNRKPTELRLWADAICINQEDLDERSQQVQLMGEIYKNAELVLASMDTGHAQNGSTELAIDTFNSIYDVLLDERSHLRMDLSDIGDFTWLRELPSLCIDVDDPSGPVPNAWQAIDFFQAEHPYFRRVWILQEFVLAEDLIFVCNSHSISLARLVSLSVLFNFLPPKVPPRPSFLPPRTWNMARKFRTGTGFSTVAIELGIKSMVHTSLFKRVVRNVLPPAIQTAMNFEPESNRQQDDPENMAWTIIFLSTGLLALKATDPRDYFYGLMGLSKLEIVVDYNKSVKEVYREFCQRRLEASEQLCKYQQHFLAHFSGVGFTGGPQGLANPHDLPSWAPNFDVGALFLLPDNMVDPEIAFRQMRKMLAFQIQSTSWVGDGLQADYGVFTSLRNSEPYIDKEYALFIPGVRLQRITRVHRFNQNEEAKSRAISYNFLQYCASLISGKSRHPSGKPWLLVVLESLMCDGRQSAACSCEDPKTRQQAFIFFTLLAYWGGRSDFGDKSNPWVPEEYSNFHTVYSHFQGLFFLPRFHQPSTSLEISGFRAIWERAYIPPTENIQEDLANFAAVDDMVERIHAFSSCLWLETEDGYIGRGPPYMVAGDIVCVVKGCGLPILLRVADKGYTHVGVCWIEGFLDGEALEALQSRRASIEWFEIY